MRLCAVIILLVCLYLLIRMIYPKRSSQSNTKGAYTTNGNIDKNEPYNVLGKSRFVSRLKSQPQPTHANSSESAISEEYPDTFAPEKQPREVLSPQESDSFFYQEPNISITLEVETKETEPESDVAFDEEEDEELRQVLNDEVALASGVTYEQMDLAFNAINHSNGNNQAEASEILYHMQDTEYISQLSAISYEKTERIKALIALHEQNMGVETKDENSTNSVDITAYLP